MVSSHETRGNDGPNDGPNDDPQDGEDSLPSDSLSGAVGSLSDTADSVSNTVGSAGSFRVDPREDAAEADTAGSKQQGSQEKTVEHTTTRAGFLFCVGSSVGYTATNAFLRAATDVDPVWVACVKAAPTLLLVLPWLASDYRQGKRIVPPTSMIIALFLVSLLANFGGNVLFQWSLGIVGMALSASITLGAMIVSGALLGWIALKEQVGLRAGVSCLVLLAGIAVLSLGAEDANQSLENANAALVSIGVAAACIAGFAYSSMGVVMRYGLRRGVSVVSTLAVLSLVGWTALATWAYLRIGWSGILATNGSQWTFMILAGVANALAFVCLTKALQATTVLMVNGVNASQAALCGLVGIVVFGEAFSLALLSGVALTVVGLLIMRR